jgi:6-phosphofructokinase
MGLAYRRVALSGRAVERHSAEYRISFELRVATLGHVQRGVTSSFFDWRPGRHESEEETVKSLIIYESGYGNTENKPRP